MIFLIYSSLFLLALSFTANEIYKLIPEPFMDEVFHIRQAHEYFMGNYGKWDPMITTPPGLYAASVSILKGLKLQDSVASLRLINLIFGVAILLVSRAICRHDRLCNERSLLISSLPNLFIFYTLYYTDAGSVLFVLLAHLALIKKRPLLFLFCSVFSLTFRQTNIIWVAGFCIADRICSEVKGDLRILWKRKSLYKMHAYLTFLLLGIFSYFVYLNDGSIALGDKESHVVSLHFVQFFYCNTTIFAFCWPLLLHKEVLKTPKRSVVVFLIASFLCYFAVRFGTIVHPYLLADNRHWTNFVWRRLLRFEVVRFALIPLHALTITLIFESLMGRGIIWILGYFSTCAIVLVPSPLIEPRYYILPLVFFLFNCKIPSKSRVFLQIGIFFVINAFIIGTFLYRPFTWSHVPGVSQRRIW